MPACRLATAAPEEEHVHGACGPGWDPAARTVDGWVEFMRAEGIERVCCLLSDAQVAEYDGLLDDYRAAFGEANVSHVPVADHTLMAEATLANEVIPFLERAVDDAAPVVVHCRAGIDRTGQTLAGWLVHAHGYRRPRRSRRSRPATAGPTTLSGRATRPDPSSWSCRTPSAPESRSRSVVAASGRSRPALVPRRPFTRPSRPSCRPLS